MTAVQLARIELDTSIQCRAVIDTALVNEYAERMEAGDKFPPVVLFGDRNRCWIGDGWHRVMAAKQVGADTILADLKPGARADALKYALGANAAHGHRRSNADKRRCVEIALREFGNLSTAAMADLCGVSRPFVESLRPQDATVASSRTGKDGKRYAARRTEPQEREPEASRPHIQLRRPVGPPCDGMQFARLAVMQLEQIRDDDSEREQALNHVKEWIENHESHIAENV